MARLWLRARGPSQRPTARHEYSSGAIQYTTRSLTRHSFVTMNTTVCRIPVSASIVARPPAARPFKPAVTALKRNIVIVRAEPAPDAVETAIKGAEEACKDGATGECAAAWDEVGFAGMHCMIYLDCRVWSHPVTCFVDCISLPGTLCVFEARYRCCRGVAGCSCGPCGHALCLLTPVIGCKT